ncbi:MAG: DNA circularization N-terminal domain-containing protein [Evtepia gabavorous]
MELTPMQYKSYVWPHNPRTYTIQYVRKVAVHKVPFGRYAMQDLGLGRRVMKGEGEFYGAGAYEEFKKLASVFYHSGPGTLIHPVWQSAKAYFVDLTLAQEPRQDYVRYTFTFWEDNDRYREQLEPVRPEAGGGGQNSGRGSVRGSGVSHGGLGGDPVGHCAGLGHDPGGTVGVESADQESQCDPAGTASAGEGVREWNGPCFAMTGRSTPCPRRWPGG